MKKLFDSKKSLSPKAEQPGKASLPANSSAAQVKSFLSEVAAKPKPLVGKQGGRLLFALDATASRQATWDVATQLQAEMFTGVQKLGGLQVQLCFFRGFAEFFASPWQRDGAGLRKLMTGIRCEAGATKIQRVLKHALEQAGGDGLQAVVYIGDAMEENLDLLADLAGKLGLRNVPLFMFQEHSDQMVERAYRDLARLSGGAYSRFDSSSAGQLQALLRAVAVYASGGRAALQQLSSKDPAAVALLEQLRK